MNWVKKLLVIVSIILSVLGIAGYVFAGHEKRIDRLEGHYNEINRSLGRIEGMVKKCD